MISSDKMLYVHITININSTLIKINSLEIQKTISNRIIFDVFYKLQKKYKSNIKTTLNLFLQIILHSIHNSDQMYLYHTSQPNTYNTIAITFKGIKKSKLRINYISLSNATSPSPL